MKYTLVLLLVLMVTILRGAKGENIDMLEGARPNILYVLMDDLGYHDVGFSPFADPREKILQATSFITSLAKEEGMILTRHYAHSHCSPSRRAFLTGRWTIHTGGDSLSNMYDDDLDLRMEWIPERLKKANYTNFLVGKVHTGYKSIYHLPALRGYDRFSGILGGQSEYYDFQYWEDIYGNKKKTSVYNTLHWGREAREMMSDHFEELDLGSNEEENILKSKNKPFFMSLNFQTPHTPTQPPSKGHFKYGDFTNKKKHPYEYMIYSADVEIRETIELLKSYPGIWENTLVIFSSDNGGVAKLVRVSSGFNNWETTTRGSNYPFRGEKSNSFEGGLRVPAFLSGGFLPVELRGTTNGVISHISDWFATFAYLAGVSVKEEESTLVKELIDESQLSGEKSYLVQHLQNPYILEASLENSSIVSEHRFLESSGDKINVWQYLDELASKKRKLGRGLVADGGQRYDYGIYPALDSVNLVPYLFSSSFVNGELSGFHPVERDSQKLILTTEVMLLGNYKFILAQPCGLQYQYDGSYSCKPNREMYGWRHEDSLGYTPHAADLSCGKMVLPTDEGQMFEPCVFDLSIDAEERNPIDNTTLMNELWKEFNNSMTFKYDRLLVNKEEGVTPPELMDCDTSDYMYSRKTLFGTSDAPKCDKNKCTRVSISGTRTTVCSEFELPLSGTATYIS
eukprot:maker-scaffold_13-snap-gene-3.59-mRNA-1 protein AED:0.00 eAED:0.00 QI:112/1/1/1/1/1/2/96/682